MKKNKNSQPQTKFTGSYKKKRLYVNEHTYMLIGITRKLLEFLVNAILFYDEKG